MKKYIAFLISIIIAFIPSMIGVFYRPGAWYLEIAKPEWNPPGWIFGPVWTMLYLSMAVAAWLVWQQREKIEIKIPLIIYSIHLILNALWSWIFFGIHNLPLSVIEILLLWASIVGTIILFYKIRKLAGLILIPYLLWVSFASYLNYTIWVLN